MIDAVSLTLGGLLDATLDETLSATIVFERPDNNFAPSSNTLDLFLYDLRENLELRSNERVIQRDGGAAVIHKPPRRIDCSYLVTAWPVSPNTVLFEQKLLGEALQVLGRYPTIPSGFVDSALGEQEWPLPMIAPQIDGLKSLGDFWSAMEIPIRPSFTVTVTIGMPQFPVPEVTAHLVTTKAAGFDPGTGAVEETLFQVGGRVLGEDTGEGIAGAVVDVLDPRLRATTDAEGRYRFVRIPGGPRTFRAVAVDYQPLTPTVVDVPGQTQDYEFTLTKLP